MRCGERSATSQTDKHLSSRPRTLPAQLAYPASRAACNSRGSCEGMESRHGSYAREYIRSMRVLYVVGVAVGLLVAGALPAHAQLTIGSVGGAFVPAGGTSNASTGPVTIPGEGPGVLAIPSGASRALAPSGVKQPPLPPLSTGPHPSGLVSVPVPLVASPYLTQPKLNPCLATYVSSKCGSAPPATATYPSGRIK
jgi:hypothetical protein